jgi:histidinol phosphatase-like enzyme
VPGLLLRAAREHGIDLGASWLIGDILHDVEAAHRAGCRAVLVAGGETEWVPGPYRTPDAFAEDFTAAANAVIAARDRTPAWRCAL